MSSETITISVYEKKFLGILRGNNETRINGKISYYEETYDGTESGLYKFRKDVASAVGYDLKDDFEIEVSTDGNKWSRVTDGASLDAAIKLAKGKITVRVAKKASYFFPTVFVASALATAAVGGFLLAKKH